MMGIGHIRECNAFCMTRLHESAMLIISHAYTRVQCILYHTHTRECNAYYITHIHESAICLCGENDSDNYNIVGDNINKCLFNIVTANEKIKK